MKLFVRPEINDEEEFLAELTEIAYRALLHQGLQRSFVEVELELWDEIRRAYRRPRDSNVTFDGKRQISWSFAAN